MITVRPSAPYRGSTPEGQAGTADADRPPTARRFLCAGKALSLDRQWLRGRNSPAVNDFRVMLDELLGFIGP